MDSTRLTTDLFYMASDHLSSASLMMDATVTTVSSQRYLPFGEVRHIDGLTDITQTDLGYTGQRMRTMSRTKLAADGCLLVAGPHC
jgi:hypothetical protein